MIIIKIHGGLGNQLFQYALYKKLHDLGKEVYCDISKFKLPSEPQKYCLPLLGIKVETVEEEQSNALRYGKNKLFGYIKYRLHIPNKTLYIEQISTKYLPEVFNMETCYLEGYWQTEKYFKDIRQSILEEISFKTPSSNSFYKIDDDIKHCNSVSIHARFGDYLNNPGLYGGICTFQYYKKAIEYIERNVENPKFFVFSDDKEKVKELFPTKNFIYVEDYKGDNSYLDMYLMSKCKHNIIANSSFSWWASWLNTNSDKIVIAPKTWINGYDMKDITCDNWIRF